MTTPNINRILARPEYRRNCSTGAPMGRTNTFTEYRPRLNVQRIAFIDGDYSADGTYWGGGEPLYAGFSQWPNGDIASLVFVRASSREEAVEKLKEEYPLAQFHRGQTSRLLWATFNRFELALSRELAESCAHSGDCDNDVARAVSLPSIRKQLDAIHDASLAAELKEYGTWDEEELKDREANDRRIVWLAAGNIVEELQSK